MIVLFTDFGFEGPYVGQMKAVLAVQAPGVPVLDLMHDAPACNPRAAAYLLSALVDEFALDTVFVGVVDPGVGDQARRPVVLRAEGRWYVGPDNGLFAVVAARARSAAWWEITWQPPRLSSSFHGRDLFAPMAAHIASRGDPEPRVSPIEAGAGSDWPADLYEIIYVDGFGNAMTGIRAAGVEQNARVTVDNHTIGYATTFSEVPPGEPFWYANSSGLVEIAVNGGAAGKELGIEVGDLVSCKPSIKGTDGSSPV